MDTQRTSHHLLAASISRASVDVLIERQRQTATEGWTHAHDDGHDAGVLAAAAAAYALAASQKLLPHHHRSEDDISKPPTLWPFGDEWWKPGTDPRRMLVKAGALILAEIERIDRMLAVE